jgi:hypothetical protein
MLSDNKYDPTKNDGAITGDHLALLSKTGIHNLIERVHGQIRGDERRLTGGDLPPKVQALVEKADKLADQIKRCESVDLDTAKAYLFAQNRIAAEALPMLASVLQEHERAAKEAVAALRANLTGKGGPIAAAAADILLLNADVVRGAEHEAALPFWRTAWAICRDNAIGGKNVPRWLTILIAAHESHKIQSAVGS